MRKNIFFIMCLSAFPAAAADTANVFNGQHINALNKIAINTEPVFCKTPEFIAVLALFVALCACIWTWIGALSQRSAEKNTRTLKQMQKAQQEFILLDLIRHIYRNKVIISALQWKLDGKYDTHYPSDEHILKLRIPLEELQLDKFYGEEPKENKLRKQLCKLKISGKPKSEEKKKKKFDDIHRLKILCRNVNIEIGIAYEHLKMSKNQFLAEDKRYDLEVLEFKCQHLTKTIIDLMRELNLLNDAEWDREVERIRSSAYYKSFECVENKNRKEGEEGDIKDEYLQKVRILLYDRVKENNKEETVKFADYYAETTSGEVNEYRKVEEKYREEKKGYLKKGKDKKIYYSEILHISAQLHYDVYMEGKGKEDEKGEKRGVIKLIKFIETERSADSKA